MMLKALPIALISVALTTSACLAEDQRPDLLLCLGWAAESGPGSPGATAFRALAALASTEPAGQFRYLVPAFKDQGEDFWRGFMIATSLDNATRYVYQVGPGDPKSVAQKMFAEGHCDVLVK